MTVEELVRAAAAGDQDAFAQLVALYEKRVYALQGLPKQPRPIMAMSAPVCRRMRTASWGENTSPLAMTGMDTACRLV